MVKLQQPMKHILMSCRLLSNSFKPENTDVFTKISSQTAVKPNNSNNSGCLQRKHDAGTCLSVNHFETVFNQDLSSVGGIEIYHNVQGYLSAVALKTGVVEVVKCWLLCHWPQAQPKAIICYAHKRWLFYLYEDDKKTQTQIWQRLIAVTNEGVIFDFGGVAN